MKVLITGKGTSGSWAVRGEQLGKAMGVSVQPGWPKARRFDLAVLVKRPNPDLMRGLAGVPIVWDVVDSWPQPSGNAWDRETSLRWLRDQVREIRPIAFVAATQAMALDLAEFGKPILTLPHHARPGIALNPIRDTVQTVGYEGGSNYLGAWNDILQRQCRRRGWQFVLNPKSVADLDIVVALREVAGYPIQKWKSNVKLANAQGSGTPCILAPEAGYLETQSGAEAWAEDERTLSAAMDFLEPRATRAVSSQILRTSAPLLQPLADRYLAWLNQLPLRS